MQSARYIIIEKFLSAIDSLFFVRTFPIMLKTRSAGVEVPCTDKYLRARMASFG